jgi:DNA modification methylase
VDVLRLLDARYERRTRLDRLRMDCAGNGERGCSVRTFHDGKVTLHAGDCLDVLEALPEDSIDAVVTDPPYHLTNNNGTRSPYPGQYTPIGKPRQPKGGFMGKQWDGGDIAFRPELWAEVLRVLKPGGHMVCFGGTRTYHRMVCAIEDAGFEVRDQLAWVYGSGFPKSHDVSKGIDRRQDYVRFPDFAKHYAERRKAAGLTHAQVCALGTFYGTVNHGGMSANWEAGLSLPTVEQWNIIAPVLGLPQELYVSVQREEIGSRKVHKGVAFTSSGPDELPITLPATDAARQWQGWGTALKPAWEPICLARKPLSEGTVAANVLRWGTGALNIDGCRIPTGAADDPRLGGKGSWSFTREQNDSTVSLPATTLSSSPLGRWPANLCHDGSAEVLVGFPETTSGKPVGKRAGSSGNSGIYHSDACRTGSELTGFGDSGSAARFFYTSKAGTSDRLNSKHPTVKPVDLMQWLVRLVCPKGATVLDPFAGTGTTGEAAFREGCKAVLIEREFEYLADIERRMELLLSGPDERSRKLTKPDPHETLPLFS